MEHNSTSAKKEKTVVNITKDILRTVGQRYHASCAYLFYCGLDNSIALMVGWTADAMLHGELHISDIFVANWKEHLGMNRAVFIPKTKETATSLGFAMPENLLGELRGESEKPSLLLLLGGVEQPEDGYEFLEMTCEMLYLSNRLFDEAEIPDKKPRILPAKIQVARNGFTNARAFEYYEAMLSACDMFYDVDLFADTYRVVKLGRNPTPQYNSFTEFIHSVARTEVHPEDRERYLKNFLVENMLSIFSQGEALRSSTAYRKKGENGEYIWKKAMLINMDKLHNKYATAFLISFDLDEFKMDEQSKLIRQLEIQEKKFSREIRRKDEIQRVLGEQTKLWIFEWSRKVEGAQGFALSFISPDLAEEFQFYRQDIHLFTHLLLTNRIFEADLDRFCMFLEHSEESCPEIICRITKNGLDYLWYQLTKRTVFDEAEQEKHMIGTVLNVDDETRMGQLMKRKAKLDMLTGLLNQDAFYAGSQRLIDRNQDTEYAVIIMDIDNFKLINSLYGMDIGNEVLAQIGHELVKCISKAALCARVYADVFYIITAYQSDELITSLIESIIDKLSYIKYGAMLQPCFGISNSKDFERSVTLLCELAGFAHKHGKGKLGERYVFYNASIRQTIIEEKQMESEMEFALQNGQFQVYLQPKYVISTREIVGAEALVRWEHPSKGMIGPIKFISLFEKNGFIIKLDEYIWEQVCVILHRWQANGVKCIPISVNMSRLHLNNRDFQSTIVNLLGKYHISHKWFELELTENLLFENFGQMISILTDLQSQGFYINMDDFGSGYSSLNMLRNIPIDVLKIDGNFFDEKMLTPKGKTIVKYVVAMAKELNMRVVAEGVENPSQEKFLMEVGCEIAQGFHFSKPIPVAAFESKCWHIT